MKRQWGQGAMEAPPLFTHTSLLLNSQFTVASPITSHSHSLSSPKVTHEISKFLSELFCRSVTRKIVLDPVQPGAAASASVLGQTSQHRIHILIVIEICEGTLRISFHEPHHGIWTVSTAAPSRSYRNGWPWLGFEEQEELISGRSCSS